MNHSYIPSQIDGTKCSICKYGVLAHTSMATCECCSYIGHVEIYKTMLMCPSCIEKEKILETESKIKESERVNAVLDRAKNIDYSIETIPDFFNAETVPFNEIKAAIDTDDSITNKPYEFAKIVRERIDHFSKIISDKQNEIKEASNRQRFWQQQANSLVSKLREEEREEFRFNDINYRPPDKDKVVKKPKAISTAKKYDKAELVEWANKGGWPLNVLQGTCVAQNMNPKQAYEYLKGKGF